jgi:hypothetical protein
MGGDALGHLGMDCVKMGLGSGQGRAGLIWLSIESSDTFWWTRCEPSSAGVSKLFDLRVTYDFTWHVAGHVTNILRFCVFKQMTDYSKEVVEN